MSRLLSFFFEKPRITMIAEMAHDSLKWPLVLVPLNHVARCIVNANHSIMHTAGFRSAQ
jgi:hypothetical protein